MTRTNGKHRTKHVALSACLLFCLDMRPPIIGRCAQGASWLFIFMTTRIRVKINGSDAGKVLLIEDNWQPAS